MSSSLADGPILDFSGNFASPSADWRRRVLTPFSGARVNYSVVAGPADVGRVTWVGGRDEWFSGAREATIDALVVGGRDGEGGGGESSARQWLSRGEDDVTGQHFITVHVQSWLQGRGGANGIGGDGSTSPQPGDYMRLRIEWTRPDGPRRKGVSSSGLFTVAESEDTAAVLQKWNQEIVQTFDGGQQNGYEEDAAPETGSPPPPSPPPPLPSSTTEPSSGNKSSSPSPSPPMSPGAVAGIATGCGIAVILLTTALIWYVVTRRRRPGHGRRPHQQPVRHGDDAHGKTAARAAHPTQPPYSEVNLVGGDYGGDGGVDSSIRHQHVAPAANFAQRGMTDDERQRWDEEERQLDDEIARKQGR
ncbi:hypothetical protein E4U42_003874 [Claviceps africana]|uniref:Uncharacterized protein n=1 Tax=Claviceps africana TaxID=83212 RepID=A0A8K0J8G0_9HYPO|nr:hypothetical protein E4U42_003874 [Claviceps africana]